MKTPEKTESSKTEDKKQAEKKAGVIETDYPLSEKDEVKKAEQELQKRQDKSGK